MLLPILSLLSCSKDINGDTPISDIDGGVEICFAPSISADISLNSRGIIGETSLPQNSVVGICGIHDTTGSFNWNDWLTTTGFYQPLDNARYKVIHTGNPQLLKLDHPDPDIRVKMPELGKVNFYAYYPYTESLITVDTQAPSIPVYIAPNVVDTPDYMFASASAAITDVPENSKTITVPLSFEHALARVDIYTIVQGNEIQNPPVLNTIKITTTQGQSGQMDITTGNITFTSGGNTEFTVSLPTYSLSTQKELAAQFMFIPSENAIQSIILNITNETGTNDYTVYTNEKGAINLEKGSISPIILKYTRTANMSSEVKEWGTKEDQTFEVKN